MCATALGCGASKNMFCTHIEYDLIICGRTVPQVKA
jgi:hypothetical protein